MRLGAYPCQLAEGSFARAAYGEAEISERHRHRYEFNREYEDILTQHGLRLTGETPDGIYVEICELADHPWYLGCQFHPEFKSKPLEPHPLFRAFIGAALEHRKRRKRSLANRDRLAAKLDGRSRSSSRWPIRIRRRAAAGADRRPLRDRKRGARPLPGRGNPQDRRRRSSSKPPSTRPTARASTSYRGPGLKEGLRILKSVRDDGIPVLTDIHEPAQAELAAEAVDILQIPAFLCRQTDLLVAAGRTGTHRQHQEGPVRRAARHPARGRESRLHRQQQDPAHRARHRPSATTTWWWTCAAWPSCASFGWPVVFDATHSVQLPGAAGTASGGQPRVHRAAVARGGGDRVVDGSVRRSARNPAKALSDGANALRLDLLAGFLDTCPVDLRGRSRLVCVDPLSLLLLSQLSVSLPIQVV